MKKLLPLLLLVFSVSVFAQKSPDPAIGSYAENGRLISLTNLTGLSDCPAMSVTGKVTKLKVRKGVATIRVKADGEKRTIQVPLERLTASDRLIIFHELVTSKTKLRIAGYSCGTDGIMTAFSIDRVY